MIRPAARTLLKILPPLIAILVCYLVFQHLDLKKFWTTLHTARWGLVAAAVFINLFFNTFARVKRFAALLEPLPARQKIGLWELNAILLATRTVNAVLPAKAGEALRTLRLTRFYGYTWDGVVAAILVEPLIEASSLALPAWFLLTLAPPASGSLQYGLRLVAAVVPLAVALSLLLAWYRKRQRVSNPRAFHEKSKFVLLKQRLASGIDQLTRSLHLLNSRRTWSQALGWSVMTDFTDLLTIGLCLAAVGIDLPAVHWFLILIAVNVAILIPTTPGNMGTLEAGATLALGLMGVDASQALAFAVLYHASHLVPVTLVGSFLIHSLGGLNRAKNESQALSSPSARRGITHGSAAPET